MLQYGIPDFSRARELALNEVRFHFLGGTYSGRGLLKWAPERGFHLDAFLDRHGPPLPDKIEFGKFGVVQLHELRQLRMSFDGGRGLSARIAVGDHLELIHACRLSADFSSSLFWRNAPAGIKSSKHYGSGVLDIGKPLVFPDSVERQTTIEGKRISGGVSRDGITFDANDIGLEAIQDGNGHLKIDWELSADTWTRAQAWGFGPAVADALTFLGGRTVRVLERRTYRGNREYIERRRSADVHDLKFLAMVPRQSQRADQIEKEQFIMLTLFFLRGGAEADIARRICAQIAEATQQRTRAAMELLCSTVLEAVLRTIYEQPFQRGDHSFKIRESIDCFRDDYLTPQWKDACDKALLSRESLRNRNAHPDWLTGHGGGMSTPALQKSLDDMIHLAWFYGYMILAMAGFKNLEPNLPGPHEDWGSLITMSRGDPA